ncbi:DNA methyltransferase [uncultured Thiothrix sp.]|uniref:class I SAM-dependent DNA methyltransferase n=1 Tax=uncultured Thiothrix sp. TaxID=223185 RepID=UPI002614D4E7|nr:DNA methyltransferase [uncultured Thiothrix sp.]HMT92222.1 class I SAM-dependent DNA methyltransferase [Thiolinea sp.]
MSIATEASTAFIQRWQGKTGYEKANYQLFLTELCDLLAVEKPQPAQADNQQNAYVFERRVDLFDSSGKSNPGFIDLYKRDSFVLEAKSTGKKVGSGGLDVALERAYNQAEGYIKNLPQFEKKSPFLIVTDVGHVLQVYSEFSCSGSTYTAFPDQNSYRIKLEDLAKAEIRERLRAIWLDPHSLDPSKKAALVTRIIATHLAELAKSLEQQHSPEQVGTFLMRCLFTMFAEDVGLLPEKIFTQLLEKLKDKPESCAPALKNLWTLMDTGGFEGVSMEQIKRFNGGLFAEANALALNKAQIALLLEASLADWRFVEPAIFGTLLERALNPKERHKLGAHYTPRAYVERLVFPTVIEPLREEWKNIQAAAVLLEQQKPSKKGKKTSDAIKLVQDFHTHLCSLRILDPACGSGNFLYVTLEHMKKLEGEILDFLQQLGFVQTSLEMESVSVSPQQFLGIEVNPRAAKIAEMVLWIGYLQWHFRTHGNVSPPEPILRDFHNIECRDAVLAWEAIEPVLDESGKPVTRWDGVTMKVHPVMGKDIPDEAARVLMQRYVKPRKAVWPKADFIVGNPPFIGNKRMRTALGDGYVDALRATWLDVPDSADFVMYWWHQAAEIVRTTETQRFGFITTNSLRQTFNRKIVQNHLEAQPPLSLIFAIPDHPWVDSYDGASVRISLTVGDAKQPAVIGKVQSITSETETSEEAPEIVLNSKEGIIHADLTAGANVASAKTLLSNTSLSFMGVILVGTGFLVEADNPIIKSEPDSVKKYLNGRDLTQTSRNTFVIDFHGLTQQQALEKFPNAYQKILTEVRPFRMQVQRLAHQKNWWIFGESRSEMRAALNKLKYYFATPMTAKHRLFVQISTEYLADQGLISVTSSDTCLLGILSSRLHILWSLALGGTLENRPRYNNSTCFETFPFPNPTETQKTKIRDLAERLDSHRKRQQAAHPELTLTNMYNVLEKLRTGETLNDKEKITHQQGLITILQELHDDLDRAVFDAYGWNDLAEQLVGKAGATNPLPDKPEAQAQAEEELLSRLVALNTERANEEAQGLIRWLRPEFQAPHTQSVQQTELAVDVDETETVSVAVASQLAWPKALPEQVKLVRSLLTQSRTLNELNQQFKTKPKALEEVLETLCVLGNVQCAQGAYRLI